MKKIFLSLLGLFALFSANMSYAIGIFGSSVTETEIKNGDITAQDIPNMIAGAINFFLSIAGTIAVIFVIIGGYQIIFGSISSDRTKGRDTIIAALGGFALAALAWVIIKVVLANLA